MFAVRAGLNKFKIDYNFEIRSIIQYYAEWVREGKLKVNSDWNKDLGVKFTVQDPCNIGRKSGSNKIIDDLKNFIY